MANRSALAVALTLASLTVAPPARTCPGPEEIPIERCDRLPVVTVQVAGEKMHFLVDTGATSFLNLKSFSAGKLKEVRVASWKGEAATSAREVTLPELALGSYRARDLKLPAIDLGPIAQACGGQIDGILGVDLLEKMGATLDLKRRIARLDPAPAGSRETALLEEYRATRVACIAAFNRGDADFFSGCLDPEVVLYTPWEEVRGRQATLEYLRRRYFSLDPPARIELRERDLQVLGEAVWFAYDYTIKLPQLVIEARGNAVCRKTEGRWRLLNMHNSIVQHAEPAR